MLSELLDVAGHRWRREQWDEPGRFVRTRLCEIGLLQGGGGATPTPLVRVGSAPADAPTPACGGGDERSGVQRSSSACSIEWGRETPRTRPREERSGAWAPPLLETSVYPASKGQTRVARGRFRLEQTDPLAMASATPYERPSTAAERKRGGGGPARSVSPAGEDSIPRTADSERGPTVHRVPAIEAQGECGRHVRPNRTQLKPPWCAHQCNLQLPCQHCLKNDKECSYTTATEETRVRRT